MKLVSALEPPLKSRSPEASDMARQDADAGLGRSIRRFDQSSHGKPTFVARVDLSKPHSNLFTALFIIQCIHALTLLVMKFSPVQNNVARS